ncbi:MAG: putative signal transducing protein [Dissulfurispiraceae bacterium]
MSEEWVDVLVTCDPVEAEMVKDLLESGGIPVVLRSSKVSPFPVNIGKIGEIRLLVPLADRVLAEKVIRGEDNL